MKTLGSILMVLPLVVCVTIPISIFITYGMAVKNKHVAPIWPYVSHTGTLPPESCVFGFFLNIASFIFWLIIYVKHQQVAEYSKVTWIRGVPPKMNVTSSVFGYISGLGLNIVANFQETSAFLPHITGALLCFVFGTLYCAFQAAFTYRLFPKEKSIIIVRLILTAINVVTLISTFAPLPMARAEYKGNNILQWTEKDGGFVYHLISTISEWILVLSFCAYMGTVYWDLKGLKLDPLKIQPQVVRPEEEARNEEVKL